MKSAVCIALALIGATVLAGELRITPGSHAVLTECAPRDIALRDLKLREAGLKAAPLFPLADEIRVFENKAAMNEATLARIWINSSQTNAYWFYRGGSGSAENFIIRQSNAIVIVARGSTNPVVVPRPDN